MSKSVEERVAYQDEKYRGMLGPLVETIWVIDTEKLIFLYINPQSYETRGYTQEEIIGMSVKKLLTEESFYKLQKIFKEAQKELLNGISRSWKIELQVLKKNNKKTWIEVNTKLVKEDTGELKIVGISRDINERKKAELEKEMLLRELKAALVEKDHLRQQVQKLESLLPICSSCRRIRDKEGKKWWPIEKYIEENSGSKFSHTICPDCKDIYYSK